MPTRIDKRWNYGAEGDRQPPEASELQAGQTNEEVSTVTPPLQNEQVGDTPQENTGLSSIEKSIFISEIAEKIREVYDPEIPVNVYDLGLIYDIQVDDEKNAHIVMTLTSPACPVAGILPGEVEMAARRTPEIGTVSVELTWDPPYTIDMMPYEIRVALGLD